MSFMKTMSLGFLNQVMLTKIREKRKRFSTVDGKGIGTVFRD